MRVINYIVVHCTATPQSHTIADMQRYWRETLKWSNPGYHYVVLADGSYRSLQDISLTANGVKGYNHNSIHISYIGGVVNGKPADNRTPQQKATLERLLKELKTRFPGAKIKGHRDFSRDTNGNGIVDSWERIKECPCFDAIPEYAHI
jgi:N-acetylmuramoyl-L-alanine amidase